MQSHAQTQSHEHTGSVYGTEQQDGDGSDENASSEPVIEWRHLVKALSETRSSISPQERKRLTAIYREFVVGRNGELPDGQAGTEIGGRTSLM